MKVISNISQTYGNFRYREINLITGPDRVGMNIRNNLDIHTFSFHNCPNEFINNATEKIRRLREDTLFFSSNKPYGLTIRRTLEVLKEKGVTDILFLQDDQFCPYSECNILIMNIILDWYRKNNCYWLNLYGDRGLQPIKKLSTQVIKNGLEVYSFDSRDFQKIGLWGYSDGAYLASIDLLLEHFFTSERDNMHTWDLEEDLNELSKEKKFIQWSTNAQLFLTYQCSGVNANYSVSDKDKMKFFFDNITDDFGSYKGYKQRNEKLI